MFEQSIETYIGESLTGEARKNVENLFVYLLKNDFQFERGKGYWAGKLYWMIKYKNEYACFVLIGGENNTEPGGWTIWSDDSGTDCFEDNTVDVNLQETVWKHVDICGNCGGCGKPGGSRKTIFGKEFENVCVTTMRFDNPDAETVECVKKLVKLRKNYISKGNGEYKC